jgi:type VI secretion system protein ImpA
MALRDDLLNPIAGASPAGADLRYDPIYDKIKEARREEDMIPSGGYDRPRKLADWPQVIKLASDAIATKSKDLQLTVWLTEALLRREGYAGLASGLTLARGLVTQFWDGLYPEMEDGDLELRAVPLDWLGSRLDFVLKSVPINKSGHTFWSLKEAPSIPTEKDAEKDKEKAALRKKALEDGKVSVDMFDKAFDATPKVWLRQLAGDISSALAAVDALDEVCQQKFGDSSPSFRGLKDSVTEVQHTVQQLIERKLLVDPDPVAPKASEAAADGGTGAGGGAEAGPSGPLAAEPVDRNDATSRVLGAARYLRKTEPTSPVSYLMLRALRWGELRAEAPTPDPRLLEAPPAPMRTQLKTLLLDQDFAQLLEVAETVMGSKAGRGWLDLQRYVLNALDGLGSDYGQAAQAIRRELRALLAEIPTLPEMTLMDDLPTAGPATVHWLTAEGLLGGDGDVGSVAAPSPAAAAGGGEGRDQMLERALGEVRAGQASKAIDRIKRALDRENNERSRFIRQTQLANVMLEAGLDAVATPILKQLLARIDEAKLENWEAGPLVAEPMVLLYRSYTKANTEPKVRQDLYLRICKLDPVQALTLGTVQPAAKAASGEG